MDNYFFETGSTDPCFNLAFEEYLLTHYTRGNIIMLWQNDNAVVVGLNQNAAAEINADFVREHGIKVVRRTTGGGAVYHDLGNVNYSFITDGGRENLMSLSEFSRPVIAALKTLGVTAETNGRNDITVDGKKVSGTAQRIFGHRILHHGTLLFSSNTAMIQGALHADESKFISKSTKSVVARVGNIRDYLSQNVGVGDFISVLKRELTSGAKKTKLSEEELREINEVANKKYRTWEWTYGKSPKFDFSGKERFNGGTLEARVSVGRGGEITGVEFLGDFMAKLPTDGVTAALVGARYECEQVKKILDGCDTENVFGGITADEVLSVMFPPCK